jgi:hypothetical protein
MPYALCPMPYALYRIVPHLSEKGYINHKLSITSYQLSIPEYQSQITNYPLPITKINVSSPLRSLHLAPTSTALQIPIAN